MFFLVDQHPAPLENTIPKLPPIEVSVLEHLISHSIQLCVNIVATLCHPQLEVVLVAEGVRVEPALSASDLRHKTQSVDETLLLETHDKFVALFGTLESWKFVDVELDDSGMVPAYHKI